MADRYSYLPSIGLFIAITWGIVDVAQTWPRARRWLPAAAAVILLALSVRARAQVDHWKSSTTLWTHALNVTSDNYLAHASLGYVAWSEGKSDEAISHYQQSMSIRADYPDVWNYLGVVLADQKKFTEAAAKFAEAVRLKSNYADARNNLGAMLMRQGNVGGAITQFSEAVRLEPDDRVAHYNLAVALQNQARIPEAIHEFEEDLRVNPGHQDARLKLDALVRQYQHH